MNRSTRPLPPSRPRRPGGPLLLALALAASGCGEELGPERPPTARISGRVRVGDRPVSGGWIEFLPVEGTRGNLRSAPLGPDGRFAADGVAAGRDLVRFVRPPFELPAPSADPRLGFTQFTSPLRLDVVDGATIDLDLRAEALRLIRESNRRR